MKITEKQFFEDYKPQINHIARKKADREWADEHIAPYNGAMYETYGEEGEYIMNKNAISPNRIWTLLDVDGELIICAGWSFVNRMGYFVTEKPWTDINIEVENEESS